jgi:hypothetical protein
MYGAFLAGEMQRLGVDYLHVADASLDMKALAKGLPPKTLVVRGTPSSFDPTGFSAFGGFDAFLGNRVQGSSVDRLSALRFEGDVTIIDLVEGSDLRHLLSGGLDVYRPLFPLVLATTDDAIASLTSESFTRRGQEDPPVKIGDDVVQIRPQDLPGVLAKLESRRKIGRDEILAPGSEWHYHDKDEDLGASWRRRSFDDSEWATGAGELGYGDAPEGRPEATVLSYGADPRAKHPCYYFRRTFKAEKKSSWKLLLLEVMVDDGCIVYINGKERFRYNMPEGEVQYATMAGGAYTGAEFEGRYTKHALPIDTLLDGKNTIAVEVHQGSLSSSDLSFDLKMTAYRR